MDNIVLAVSTLAAFLLGSWVTYKAYQHKSPVMFMPENDDLPEPISPYEEGKKNRVEKVKL